MKVPAIIQKSFRIFVIILLLSCFRIHQASAQFSELDDIIRSGPHDANLLLSEYLQPLASGLGADLNSGWFNIARPYKPFGLDIRGSVAVSLVPEADRIINTSRLAYQEMKYLGGPAVSSTIAGDDIKGSRLGNTFLNPDTGEQEELYSFRMPGGAGYPYVPAPMAQVTLGIMLNTDISIRYVPNMSYEDDANFGLWGIGIKHGINQWLPGGKNLPFDLSVQAGYTHLSADVQLDIEPDTDEFTSNSYQNSHWRDQITEFESTGFTGNLLIGKRLPVLSFYGGVGMQRSQTTLKAAGNYPITTGISPENYVDGGPIKEVQSITNPIDIDLKGANKLHALAGLRIRLLIVTISASYTYSTYSTLNAGVGLSIR